VCSDKGLINKNKYVLNAVKEKKITRLIIPTRQPGCVQTPTTARKKGGSSIQFQSPGGNTGVGVNRITTF
jgi:hypothetical protein